MVERLQNVFAVFVAACIVGTGLALLIYLMGCFLFWDLSISKEGWQILRLSFLIGFLLMCVSAIHDWLLKNGE